MGRPRKRRREEEEVSHDITEDSRGTDNIDSPFEISQSVHQLLADFSSNSSSGIADLGYTDLGFEMTDYQENASNHEIPQGTAPPLFPDFTAWESSQDIEWQFPSSAGDPTLLETPTTCSCLPNLYSTLASFRSMPAPAFPYSLGVLKKPVRLGHTVVQCQICPKAYNTGLQNAMLLGTLVQMISNEYAKLLRYIDQRSVRDEKITFRVGEHSSPMDHRHTRTPDCPMAISIDLSGDEWRTLARKAVRQEVVGNVDSTDSLIALTDAMRKRQENLHEIFQSDTHVACRDQDVATNVQIGDKSHSSCLQITFIDQLRRSLEAFQL